MALSLAFCTSPQLSVAPWDRWYPLQELRADSTYQYQGYGGQQGGNQGYGSYNPYDQGGNPYTDSQGYSDQPSYGGRPQGQSNQYSEEQQQGGYGRHP